MNHLPGVLVLLGIVLLIGSTYFLVRGLSELAGLSRKASSLIGLISATILGSILLNLEVTRGTIFMIF